MSLNWKQVVAVVAAVGSVVATGLAQLQAADPTLFHVGAGVLAAVAGLAALLNKVEAVVDATSGGTTPPPAS